jgi:hypothetical protein
MLYCRATAESGRLCSTPSTYAYSSIATCGESAGRMISPVVDQLSKEYADENVTFYKVDQGFDMSSMQICSTDLGTC